MTIAEDLAGRVARIHYQNLSPADVAWAKLVIADTVAVTIAGAAEDAAHLLAKTILADSQTGPCLVFGTGRTCRALDAALINATAAHALDFDCHSAIGHPAAQLLPALFAVAETTQVNGPAFIAAFVAGFQIQSRLAAGMNPYHWRKGWFPSATLGVLGVAAGAAHLLGLDSDRTAHALGIATMLASGLLAHSGTMTKPLTIGHCARSGLQAALLARNGFTGALDCFEHRNGFLKLFNDEGQFDVPAILEGWQSPYDLAHGVTIKQYPCCGVVHSAIDVIGDMIAQDGLTADDVERLELTLHPRRLAHVDRPDPRTNIDAKFSLYYCLARTLQHGRPRFEDFENDAFEDADARGLMARIHPTAEPGADAASPDFEAQFATEVKVFSRTGRILCRRVSGPRGQHAPVELALEMVREKFGDCAARAPAPIRAAEALSRLEHFETVDNVGQFTRLLGGGG